MWSNFVFGSPSNCSKTCFWSSSNGILRINDHVIDKFDHVIIRFEEKFGCTKNETAMLKLDLRVEEVEVNQKKLSKFLQKFDPIYISLKSFEPKLTFLKKMDQK